MNTDLMVLPEVNETNALTVFTEKGTDPIIDGVKTLIAEFNENPPKLTTKSGRAEYKSMAANIAKSKKHVEKVGRELAANIKSEAEEILAKDKAIRDEVIRFCKEMDKLRDEVKAPALEWERADSERKAEHGFKIEAIKLCGRGINEDGVNYTAEQLIKRLERCESFELTKENCEEFLTDYELVIQAATQVLKNELIPAAQKREADEAELIRLREEKARQEAIDKANEQARIDKLKAEQAAKDAELRAKLAEEQRIIDAENAEKERIAAAELAEKQAKEREERAKQAAIDAQKEKERQEKAAADARAADVEHRKAFNREALAVIMEVGNIPQETGIEILKAIINGDVPHLRMKY